MGDQFITHMIHHIFLRNLNFSKNKNDSIKNAMSKFEWTYNANKDWNNHYRVPLFQKKMPKVYKILNAYKFPIQNETEIFMAT